jgi:hypothetical protein
VGGTHACIHAGSIRLVSRLKQREGGTRVVSEVGEQTEAEKGRYAGSIRLVGRLKQRGGGTRVVSEVGEQTEAERGRYAGSV